MPPPPRPTGRGTPVMPALSSAPSPATSASAPRGEVGRARRGLAGRSVRSRSPSRPDPPVGRSRPRCRSRTHPRTRPHGRRPARRDRRRSRRPQGCRRTQVRPRAGELRSSRGEAQCIRRAAGRSSAARPVSGALAARSLLSVDDSCSAAQARAMSRGQRQSHSSCGCTRVLQGHGALAFDGFAPSPSLPSANVRAASARSGGGIRTGKADADNTFTFAPTRLTAG